MNYSNKPIKRSDIFFWVVFGLTILIRIWLIAGIPKQYINAPDDAYSGASRTP
jgi:hypothetical protein